MFRPRWTTQMTEKSWRRLSVRDLSMSGSWLAHRYPGTQHLSLPRDSYRFSHMSRALRALQSSTKTSLRIDDEGLLSLQFLMPTPKPRGGTSDAFIEFRVRVPLVSHIWPTERFFSASRLKKSRSLSSLVISILQI